MALVDRLLAAFGLPSWPVTLLLASPLLLVATILVAKLLERAAFLRLARDFGLQPSGSTFFGARQLAGSVRGVRVIVTEGTEVVRGLHDRGAVDAARARSRRVVDVVALLPPDLADPVSDGGGLRSAPGAHPDVGGELAAFVLAQLRGREATVEYGRLRVRVQLGLLPGWRGVREAITEAVDSVEELEHRRTAIGAR